MKNSPRMPALPHRPTAFSLFIAGLVGWASAAVGQVINTPIPEIDKRLCGLCIPESLRADICEFRLCDGAVGGCSFFVVGNPDGGVRILVFCETTLIP